MHDIGEDIEPRMRAKSLFDLPTETLVALLRELPYLQLVRCRQVCQRLRTLIDDEPSLQFAIELSAAGYHHCMSSRVAGAGKLDAFRRTQRAYRNPDPRMGPKIELNCHELREHQWITPWKHIRDTLVTRASSGQRLGVLSLRSDVLEQNRFRSLVFDFCIREYFVDTSQDLLVLVELAAQVHARLHFRSFSTGCAHPKLASGCNDDMPIEGSDLPPTIRYWDALSVWHDWMVICIESDEGRAKRLYHWPTGTLTKEWKSAQFGGCIVGGSVLMPLAVGEPEILDVGDAYIGVFAIPAVGASGPRAPRELARYFLPRISEAADEPGDAHWPKMIRWALNRRTPASLGLRAVTQTWSPYHSGAHEPVSLLEITVSAFYGWFIPVSAFLTPLLARRITGDAVVQDIPWREWGPHNTRMIEDASHDSRGSTRIGVCGFHMVFVDRIISFNKYDNMNDIYPWTPENERLMRRTTQDQRPSSRRRRVHDQLHGIWTSVNGSEGNPIVGQQVEVMTARMPFSTLTIRLPIQLDRSDQLVLIEEEGGPKIVHYAAETASLQYLSF